jgi:hypothetical protein
MASWEDSEVDSDRDELLDWLWDIPDRYDVGIDEDSEDGDQGAASGVRKRLRRPGEGAVVGGAPPPLLIDDQPTQAMPTVAAFADDDYENALAPLLAPDRPPSRFSGRGIASAAVVLLVIVAGVGLGYSLFGKSNSTKTPNHNLAVETPTTTPETTVDLGAVPLPLVTTTSTTTAATTTSSVAATTTSTAVKRTTTTKATTTTSTTTTVPATTTVAATTTTSSTTTTSTTASSVPTSTTFTTRTIPKP